MSTLRTLVLVVLVATPGCAARSGGDLTASQQLGLFGVSFYETIDKGAELVSELEKAGHIPTGRALIVHQQLLNINTAQKPFTDGLRQLDDLESLPEPSRLDQIAYVLGMATNFGVHLDAALGNIPASDAAKQLIELFTEARKTLDLVRAELEPLLKEGAQ